MEAKTTRFLTQFARAVFQQWTQTPRREQFWKDGAFLHSMLEEAVAKLPRGKLKAHLARDLTPLGAQLASLLRDLHADHAQQQAAAQTPLTHGALLDEELAELELAQAAAAPAGDKQRRLAGVLALDAGLDVARHAADAEEEDAEQLAQLFALIAARSYEAPQEQQHKRGLVLSRLAVRVKQQVGKLPSNWSCSEDDDASKQVQQLRALLERVVTQDAVRLAQVSGEEEGAASLKTPWTMFYRPEESMELKQVAYDEEMAKIYGALLALAVYFPIDSDDDDEEETSDESSASEGEEEEQASSKRPQKRKQLSVVAQAQLTTRQVLLAAQMRQRGLHQNGQWLVSVLTFVHGLSKPATFLDEGEDEALEEQDRRALRDCLGQVYTRAFASVALFDQAKESVVEEKAAEQDRTLFEAVVCLRHAAHFMRVERKSSLPAITTAMAHLAGVPLPATFVSWLDHEQTASPKSVLEKATQRLWKKCIGQNRMVNILLSSTDVTTEELPLIQKSYMGYLQRVAEGKPKTQADANPAPSAEAAEEVAAAASSLFYVDNAGGEAEAKLSKSKKKRANRKKRANQSDALSPSKRSRASSN
ncbi:Vacuolar protein sorting-associated protein 13A [Phytophthora pseudosyringae]|uniref:Vacuolar protein sorting-associated protein 13A n=1 Tax=Phytophthora pseudosyringae TaxID=221518 RepID=A0A8T1WD52_9STRA|nr:Vacuolar protein sorting-associated protein 13A [Phytophthora pseudosyringae]